MGHRQASRRKGLRGQKQCSREFLIGGATCHPSLWKAAIRTATPDSTSQKTRYVALQTPFTSFLHSELHPTCARSAPHICSANPGNYCLDCLTSRDRPESLSHLRANTPSWICSWSPCEVCQAPSSQYAITSSGLFSSGSSITELSRCPPRHPSRHNRRLCS